MKKLLSGVCAALLAVSVFVPSASAATVSVGSFTLDERQFADEASVAQGDVGNVQNVIGSNFLTVPDLQTFHGNQNDVIEFGFTDNALTNLPGNDLLVFEVGHVENHNLSLSVAGLTIMGTLLESQLPNPGGFRINIFGFDLDGLGVGPGTTILSSLFLSPDGNNTPDIAAIASLTPVPLPPALLLIVSGLATLGLFGRRRLRFQSV